MRQVAKELHDRGVVVKLSRKYPGLITADGQPALVVAGAVPCEAHWQLSWAHIPVGPVWIHKEANPVTVIVLNQKKSGALLVDGLLRKYFFTRYSKKEGVPDGFDCPMSIARFVRFDGRPVARLTVDMLPKGMKARYVMKEEVKYLDDLKRGVVMRGPFTLRLLTLFAPDAALPAPAGPEPRP